MRKRLSVLLGAVLVVGITGTALGQVLQAETEVPDTTFEEAYHPGTRTLVFSVDDLETPQLDIPLTTVDVEGPNGQVNHGQVVSSFRQALKEAGVRGAGCLNRVIAQSDYGKGDQQVTVSEASDETSAPSVGANNTHDLLCKSKGNSGNGPGNGNGNATGKPEDAGRPEHAGKPAHAGNPHDDN